MATELEAKIKVSDHAPLRVLLQQAAAKRIGAVVETNSFFDTEDSKLKNAGKGLRIRINRDAENGREEAIITYKGPRKASKFKNREELEITISDAQQCEQMFKAIGFQQKLSFEKRRESWKLDKCKVELDELPHLGTFLEIEGPDEQSIAEVQHKLGLDHAPCVTDAYATMLADWLKKNAPGEVEITFPC